MKQGILTIIIVLGLLAALYINRTRPVSQSHTQYDVVRDCEQLSSQSLNEHWSYEICIKNLRKQIDPKGAIFL